MIQRRQDQRNIGVTAFVASACQIGCMKKPLNDSAICQLHTISAAGPETEPSGAGIRHAARFWATPSDIRPEQDVALTEKAA